MRIVDVRLMDEGGVDAAVIHPPASPSSARSC